MLFNFVFLFNLFCFVLSLSRSTNIKQVYINTDTQETKECPFHADSYVDRAPFSEDTVCILARDFLSTYWTAFDATSCKL
jgi:hypothetical protein